MLFQNGAIRYTVEVFFGFFLVLFFIAYFINFQIHIYKTKKTKEKNIFIIYKVYGRGINIASVTSHEYLTA
jgi:hypothetical protein